MYEGKVLTFIPKGTADAHGHDIDFTGDRLRIFLFNNNKQHFTTSADEIKNCGSEK